MVFVFLAIGGQLSCPFPKYLVFVGGSNLGATFVGGVGGRGAVPEAPFDAGKVMALELVIVRITPCSPLWGHGELVGSARAVDA